MDINSKNEELKGNLHSSDAEKGMLAERLRQVADEVEKTDQVYVRRFSSEHEVEEQNSETGLGRRSWEHTGQYQFDVSLSYLRPEKRPGEQRDGAQQKAWRIDFNNDVQPCAFGDEVSVSWCEVTDGNRSFRCESESDAEWLRGVLAGSGD